MNSFFNLKTITAGSLLLLVIQGQLTGQENLNLFSDGDLENVLVNHIVLDEGYKSHIETEVKDRLSCWRLSEGVALSENSYSGRFALEITWGEDTATATLFSDFMRVKDPAFPFGLPLVPDKEITVSFWYKTSGLKGENALTALIKLGTIKDLSSREILLELPASKEWKQVTKEIWTSELKWGGEITFSLPGGGRKAAHVLIDEVCLGQKLDGVNLVKNHSFEKESEAGTLPADWQIPLEDEWIGWLGAQYRKPQLVSDAQVSGRQSVRSDVVYADGSGLAQMIRLNQQEIKPIVIELWSKLNNVISSQTYNGICGDNYAHITLFVYHHDGTMQEVSPVLNLGITDHDWDFRRFGFMAQKPVEQLLLQITLVGSQQTTSLWVDEVRAYEPGASPDEMEARGVDVPPPSIWSNWGDGQAGSTAAGLQVLNDAEHIYLTIPEKVGSQEISIYLNPNIQSTYSNHFRYLFDVIKIAADGQVYKGTTIEKQGYTADGEFSPAGEFGIETRKLENGYRITVPYQALEMNGPSFQPFGFNIKWKSSDRVLFWNGNAANNMEAGRLLLAGPPEVVIKAIEFGKRHYQWENFDVHIYKIEEVISS